MTRRAQAIALAAIIATTAQLAMVAWRVSGHTEAYQATADEMFYIAVLGHAAHAPVGPFNPFDAQWRRAASPFGWSLPLAVSLPVRLGLPLGVWSDCARWLGSAAGAYLLIELGTFVASPAAGAAAATLTLLDPGGYSAKPLLWLLGPGRPTDGEPLPLPFSRLYDPTLTLPLFLVSMLALLGVSANPERPRRRLARSAVAFGLVGMTNPFFWTTALGAAVAVVALHPRRVAMAKWLALACVVLVIVLGLNGLGARGVDFAHHGLRLGFVRTRLPQFLRHTGFWAGAAVAGWMAWGRWRASQPSRTLGVAALGAWAVALLHTPLSGWDVQSFHYALALAPLLVTVWCAALWQAFDAFGRPRWAVVAGSLAVAAAALGGARWALAGLQVVEATPRLSWAQITSLLEAGGVPESAVVAAPRDFRFTMGVVHRGVTTGYPNANSWAVPDTLLWTEQVCAAALTGEDSASAHRSALRMAEGIPWWPDGLPTGFSLEGVRTMSQLYPILGALEAREIAAAARSPDRLRRVCATSPDYALAIGRQSVASALAAAQALGGKPVWTAPDGRSAWVKYGRERRR